MNSGSKLMKVGWVVKHWFNRLFLMFVESWCVQFMVTLTCIDLFVSLCQVCVGFVVVFCACVWWYCFLATKMMKNASNLAKIQYILLPQAGSLWNSNFRVNKYIQCCFAFHTVTHRIIFKKKSNLSVQWSDIENFYFSPPERFLQENLNWEREKCCK